MYSLASSTSAGMKGISRWFTISSLRVEVDPHRFSQHIYRGFQYLSGNSHWNNEVPDQLFLFQPLGEKERRVHRGTLKAQNGSWYFFRNMITKYTLRYNTLTKKFKIKINIIIDIKD